MKCVQCKKEFEGKRNSARFCSDKCRVKWNRKNGKVAKEKTVLELLVDEVEKLREELRSKIGISESVLGKPIKSTYAQSQDEPSYSTQWFRDAFNSAKTAEELSSLVKLSEKKIVGAWSQGQLKIYAQEIFDNKFKF